MDFFQRQEIARRSTKWLEVYFVLAVIGVVLTTYAAAVVIFNYAGSRHHQAYETTGLVLWNPRLFLGVSLGTLAIIIGGSIFKTSQLASGGSAVAEMLGGRPVDANTLDPDERKLLNVVEEMAIASGTPVPQVYVLREEHGINAFAAGHSTNDMVICATQGCLKLLTRDELQGVIGHEFSHILNGDMKINLRLMGLIFGILCIAMFGRMLLYARSDRRDRNNALPLVGLALLVIGGIGVFFAKLIKSAVSRQREFLADASSVQFTRNPAGLASALEKVGGAGSRIEDPNAEDASHFFFANGMRESFAGMFSTHPPLEERIKALDPNWDGQFKSVDVQAMSDEEDEDVQNRPVRSPQLPGLLGGITNMATQPMNAISAGALLQAGAPTAHHLNYAADWHSRLPETLSVAARDPMSAVALIYALLLSKDDATRTKQVAQLQAAIEPGIYQEAARLFGSVKGLEGRVRMPLAALSMTALRRLSPAQYQKFTATMQSLIESDEQLELFEYTLQKIVSRQLEPHFQPPKRATTQYYVLKPILPDCSVLLSALAYAGQTEDADVQRAFRQGSAKLGEPDLALTGRDSYTLPAIDGALENINRAAPQIKKVVLNACAETVAADGVIQESEAELLRAVADTLDCPIPPFINLS